MSVKSCPRPGSDRLLRRRVQDGQAAQEAGGSRATGGTGATYPVACHGRTAVRAGKVQQKQQRAAAASVGKSVPNVGVDLDQQCMSTIIEFVSVSG